MLPKDYVILKFYELGYYPKYNKFNNTYQCGCPICREGTSSGKKRRCYYLPEKDNIFCHNCGWSSKPTKWICEASGCTPAEVYEEAKEFVPTLTDSPAAVVQKVKSGTLPQDSINLSDSNQLEYYKDNDTLRVCLQIIKQRRLDVAINRPDNLYISLTDYTHKNRLVIPFVNEHNDIEFYQSRTILSYDNKKKPKYLSRINAEKTLFNINKVDINSDYVYIFEGPLNAFFTKNSVAVAGITEGKNSFTPRQQEQLDTVLKLQSKIWVLDSQWIDNASFTKSRVLLDQGERVFIWPEKIGKNFKDFNDIAIRGKLNEIKEEFIQKNSYSGIVGILKLTEIAKFRGLTNVKYLATEY